MGDLYLGQEETEKASALYEQAMSLYRQVGDRVGQTDVRWKWGCWLAQRGEFQRAIPFLEAAVAFVQEIGHPVAMSWSTFLAQVREQARKP